MLIDDVRGILTDGGGAFRDFIALRIQNVADYYFEASPQVHWDMVDDFPNLAPPWPGFLATWRTPKNCNLNGKVVHNDEAGNENMVLGAAKEMERCLWPQMRWIISLQIFSSTIVGRESLGTYSSAALPVAANGRAASVLGEAALDAIREYVDVPVGLPYCSGSGVRTLAQLLRWRPLQVLDTEERDCDRDMSSRQIACLALCFANCRNVSITQEQEHLSRAARRRGETLPIETWHTLKIEGMKQELRTARNPDGTQATLRQALHICRGHFATYGSDGRGKLFGKYAGQVWKPMHTRGSVDAGIRHKNYEIAPPEGSAK